MRFLVFNVVGGYIAGRFELRQFAQLCLSSEIELFFGETLQNLKNSEKDGDLSRDEHHDYANEIQELTDRYISKIDEALANKEQEITQV